MFENVFIIHFTGAGFIAPGIIAYLEITHFIISPINMLDNVAGIFFEYDTYQIISCRKDC